MENSPPDLDVCFCEKLAIEKIWWTGIDAGRRYLTCPDRENGCAYMLWIEPRHQERAALLVEDLQKQITALRLKHEDEIKRLKEKQREAIALLLEDEDED